RIIVASRWALQCEGDRQFKILQVNLDITRRREVEEERERLLRRLVQTQEEERRRLSRELHDHLGQQLTALRLGLEALRGSGQDPLRLGEHVEELRNLAKRLDADVDFMAWELRPTVLDGLGLVPVIGNLVQEWSKHSDIPAEFQATGMDDDRFAPEIETNLYRIAQEALNNVSKHARANRVDVILERRNNHVCLIIEANAVDFEPHH